MRRDGRRKPRDGVRGWIDPGGVTAARGVAAMRGVSEVGSVVADKREGDHKRLMRIHAPELGAQKKNRPPTFDSGRRIVHFTQWHSLDTVISSPPSRTAQNRLNIQPWVWGVLCCIAKEQSRVRQETRLISESATGVSAPPGVR